MKLFVYILGSTSSSFSVEIGESERVEDLQKKILEIRSKTIKGIDASDLELHQVNITTREARKKEASEFVDEMQLDPAEILLNCFNASPPPGRVHVVVKLPDPPENLSPLKSQRTSSGYTQFSSNQMAKEIAPGYKLLHEMYWGKPFCPELTTLPANPGPTGNDDDLLPGDQVFKIPYLKTLQIQTLFVRVEYIRVFDKIKEIYQEGARDSFVVVTGQPGIGKSSWILYCLRRLFGERKEVVIYHDTTYFRFSESGPEAIEHSTYHPPSGATWCLIDSREAKTMPESTYGDSSSFFPIYVSSPRPERWANAKQGIHNKLVLIMNPWTRAELGKANNIYPEVKNLQERYDKYGPSIRHCLVLSMKALELYEEELQTEIKSISSTSIFEGLLRSSARLCLDSTSYKIVVVKRREPAASMIRYEIAIASHYIRRLLVDELQTHDRIDSIRLLRSLLTAPGSRVMAGVLFEAVAQQTFCNRIVFSAVEMSRSSTRKNAGSGS